MSLERRLRRAQQKNGRNGNHVAELGGQLQKAMGDLHRLEGLGRAADGVEKLLGELAELRDELQESISRVKDYDDVVLRLREQEHELARQRAVFMRFLCQPDLFVGPGNYMEKFLATEQRYRAEYDALIFLQKLIAWAKEAP